MLNHVDVCFVVDTTGSMGSFIAQAKAKLLSAIGLLSADSKINLQVGLVEYRDHPPQDQSFITRVYPLTSDLTLMQQHINQLKADGGGDAPEAVYRGLYDACEQMPWRQYSSRFAILVGDAPPHGFLKWYENATHTPLKGGYSDHWQNGCPSGLDVHSVGAMAEKTRVKVYAIAMNDNIATTASFEAIATNTGGFSTTSRQSDKVIEQIVALLQAEFSNITFDEQVLNKLQQLGELDTDKLAIALDCPRLPVAKAIARLGARGLLNI